MTDDNSQKLPLAIDDALLQESAEDLYEHAPCGYLSTTPDGVIIKVNQTFLTWSGYGCDELVGRRSFADLLRIGGKLYYETHFAPLLHMHGAIKEIALDLVRKDGRVLPALISAIQVRDAGGRPVVQRLTIFDATERRQYEQEVLRAKRAAEQATTDLWQILTVLPVAVLIVGANGQATAANAAARVLAGCEGAEVPEPDDNGALADALWLRRPDGMPFLAQEQPMQRSLQAGEVIRGQNALIRPAGSERLVPVLASSAPLYDAEGGIAGAVLVLQDITPLRDLERAREMFLSAAAHDLKNPLAIIRAHAQLAQRRLTRLATPETAPVLGYLTRLQGGTDAMLDLINELLDVTHQQMGGGLDLHRTQADLVTLVRDGVESQSAGSGRTIHLELMAPRLNALVDADRVARVLSNLLANALKYSPAGSDVWVRLGREEGAGGPEAVLTVRDEGMGIPAADLPHIFEHFRRGSNVTGRIEGTGIGLASVRGIVEQHGGTIAVQSTEGLGSTFTVRLPLNESELAV